MKGVNGVLLTPAAEGWCVWRRVSGVRRWELVGSDSDPAVLLESLPAGAELTVALPEAVVVTERLELPPGEAGEIAGMVELQLEKSFPYGMEEAAVAFEVLRRSEEMEQGGVVVFCVVVANGQLEELFESLRTQGRVPARMLLYGQLLASGTRERQRELCLWKELGGVCAAIVHRGHLEFLQGGMDGEGLKGEAVSRFLLAADLAGVSGDLDGVRLDEALRELEPEVRRATGLPVEYLATGDWDLSGVSGDLVPAKWRRDQEKSRRTGDFKARVQVGAAVYLLLVAGVFLFLAWMRYGVRQIDAQLLQIQPALEEVNRRKIQWEALAPAVDPGTYTLELLYLVFRSLPNPEVKITVFEQKGGGFKVEGEAPSPIQWTEFMEKLRAEPGLAAYRIEGPPPGVLSNGGARFNIFGKP